MYLFGQFYCIFKVVFDFVLQLLAYCLARWETLKNGLLLILYYFEHWRFFTFQTGFILKHLTFLIEYLNVLLKLLQDTRSRLFMVVNPFRRTSNFVKFLFLRGGFIKPIVCICIFFHGRIFTSICQDLLFWVSRRK